MGSCWKAASPVPAAPVHMGTARADRRPAGSLVFPSRFLYAQQRAAVALSVPLPRGGLRAFAVEQEAAAHHMAKLPLLSRC